jgi:hypothetical protein
MLIQIVTAYGTPVMECPDTFTAENIDEYVLSNWGRQIEGSPHEWLWLIPISKNRIVKDDGKEIEV